MLLQPKDNVWYHGFIAEGKQWYAPKGWFGCVALATPEEEEEGGAGRPGLALSGIEAGRGQVGIRYKCDKGERMQYEKKYFELLDQRIENWCDIYFRTIGKKPNTEASQNTKKYRILINPETHPVQCPRGRCW